MRLFVVACLSALSLLAVRCFLFVCWLSCAFSRRAVRVACRCLFLVCCVLFLAGCCFLFYVFGVLCVVVGCVLSVVYCLLFVC